jgi:hypothetical protein
MLSPERGEVDGPRLPFAKHSTTRISVPHPFAFFLAKGWESTNHNQPFSQCINPHDNGCPIPAQQGWQSKPLDLLRSARARPSTHPYYPTCHKPLGENTLSSCVDVANTVLVTAAMHGRAKRASCPA